MNAEQIDRIRSAKGFIAALDQSGGSTPKALSLYGIGDDAWSTEEEMYALIHRMRTRIVTSEAFGGERIIGAILFENTMDREIEGLPSAHYLWQKKRVVPFLKVDRGLEDPRDDVQMMKPMPALDALLERARSGGIFGTKMRSVIKDADPAGIQAVVEQQFEIGQRISSAGLVPIIEPEVDIHSPQKARAEALLRDALLEHLDALAANHKVMLKLTLPEEDDFYSGCMQHPNVLRVAALSGGYSRKEANARLARNRGMIASFSRALTEGLSEGQSDAEFDAALDASIAGIFASSET
ncbi:fructose bisphosphate aldolase [Thioalkalivibrio sp. HK1]|uniref:fructose bisphosphate aldolase n=1 Tax=Thioalkalivibrio sp. HK1 TaxID=1469245 RepID=UPI0004720EDA|nr:fructose bisphosphate aldolase [Thioalkalivibrio sp. HK1]